MSKRRPKNFIRTCTKTDCIKKDCPNYIPRLKADSVAFVSCMYFPENNKYENH